MDLAHLFLGVQYKGALPAHAGEVTLVTQDSRRVCPGAVFVCARGRTSDGHDYAARPCRRALCAL